MRRAALPLRPIRGYSFSNFSTNKQVASARSTIMRYVSEARPYGCHTLVLGGPESSGKTHLLNAAGHAALVNGVFRTANTLSGEKFQNVAEDGLFYGDWGCWRQRFIATEWLAIDDVDIIIRDSICEKLLSEILQERACGKGRTLLSMRFPVQPRVNCMLYNYMKELPAISLSKNPVLALSTHHSSMIAMP